MKTLKNVETGNIRRVENKDADFLTDGRNPIWKFIPKSEWKTNRNTNPSTIQEEAQNTSEEKTAKSGKRKANK
jgi:hypothetical protein